MTFALHATGPGRDPARATGTENRDTAPSSAQLPRKEIPGPRRLHSSINARWPSHQPAIATSTDAPMAPEIPYSQTPAIVTGRLSRPRTKLTVAWARKASKPERAPDCATPSALMKTRAEPSRKAPARCGAPSALAARAGAIANTAVAATSPASAASPRTAPTRPETRPGSLARRSETRFVALTADPRPARLPTTVNVPIRMPSSPNPVSPSSRAVATETMTPEACAAPIPASAQTDPWARRARSEPALKA